jgi:hypothetical protein
VDSDVSVESLVGKHAQCSPRHQPNVNPCLFI